MNQKEYLSRGAGVNIGLLHDFLRKDVLDRVANAGTAPSKVRRLKFISSIG